MNTAIPDPRAAPAILTNSQGIVWEQRMVTSVLVAAIAVRLFLATHFNINWDEFYYLSQVHDHLRGELNQKLQTFHVHFFGWLPGISSNEVDQIIAARAAMLGLQLVTAMLLYRIARPLTGTPAALFAVAAYLSFSFVIRSGASFRTDPIATCLIMAGFKAALSRPKTPSRAAAAGLLFAAALMVTIKTALFLPSLGVILAGPIFHRSTAGAGARSAAAAALAAAMGFAILYGLQGLAVEETSARSSVEIASTSLSKGLLQAGWLPRLPVLLVSLKSDLTFWTFWLAGAGVVARRIWTAAPDQRWYWLEVACLALPVVSLFVYRNSFSYFYPTLLAPASILTAVAWHALTQWSVRRPGSALPTVIKLFTLTWFTASVIFNGLYLPARMPLEQQRSVLAEVHRAFRSAVHYLDSTSMVASFPQVGFFMSTWGMETYVHRGEPVLRKAIEDRQPPLLLANHSLLDLDNVAFPASLNYRPTLVESDRQALAAAYIHHWGPIYVAGKRLQARPGAEPSRFELLIGGRYTVEAPGPVRIDGQSIQPGQSLDLARGEHWVATMAGPQPVTLRWGESLYRPSQPPPEAPLFFLGF